jgi:hypothetical protein
MPIMKRIGLVIISPLFVLLLLAAAIDIGFVRTASQPATVKRLISGSGIYNSIVPNVLAQTKSIPTSIGDIPTTSPDITRAANAALPAPFIQQNTEMAIDSVYQWLNGQIAQPSFTIDLSGVKTLFANNIADSLQQRLSRLPACSLSQALSLSQTGFQAYSAPCLPRGVSAAAIAERVKQDIVGQQVFLKNTTISAASIKEGDSSQPVFSGQLASAPSQFQRAKKTPAILVILALLSGTGIVLLSSTKLLGLRRAGIGLLLAGIIVLLLAWATSQVAGSQVISKVKVNNVLLQQDVRKLLTTVITHIDRNYWIFGIAYSAMGLAAIAAAVVIPRKRPSGNKPGKRL